MHKYGKFECYICHETKLGKNIGSSIGSGKFLYNICRDCTQENYAFDNYLVPDYDSTYTKLIQQELNQLGGVIHDY